MAIIGDVEHDIGILVKNAQERAAQDAFLKTLHDDPEGAAHLAGLISQWGDHAPTLPAGAIYGLASSGVGPMGPMGPTIIKQGVPAMTQPPNAYQNALNSIDTNNLVQPPAASIGAVSPADQLGKPINLDSGSHQGIADTIASGLGTAADTAGSGLMSGLSAVNQGLHAVNDPFERRAQSAATGGNPQEAGFGNPEVGKTAAREAGIIANTGLQALEVPPKLTAAAVATYVRGQPHGMELSVPFTHAHMHVGSIGDALNPQQFTLYNQLHGQDVGTGILPGGQATKTATAAQEQAAAINGHALTYGRGLASVVAEPGTRPYSIISGLTDAAVAMNLDPAANALKASSEAAAASHTFAPLTDEASGTIAHYLVDNAHTSEAINGLKDWAGGPEGDLATAIADKVKSNPGGVQTIADTLGIGTPKGLTRAAAARSTGISIGMRPFYHQQTAIQWMSSGAGDSIINHLASDHSFTSIRALLGDQVPVKVALDLAHADSPDAVRSLLTHELGASIAGPVTYKWIRPPEQLRMFSQMPKGSIDLTDSQQMVQQAERTLQLAKVPKSQWDPILEPMAGARTTGEARDAYVNGLGDALALKLAEDGVPLPLAKHLTRFANEETQQSHMFNVDASGQAARAAGLSVDGEPQLLVGPHLENEIARMIPPLDYRALRQASQKSRQLLHFWNDGYMTEATDFAGGVSRKAHQVAHVESMISGQLTGAFKLGVLSGIRLPVRFLADEQAAMATAGIDSFFSHPMRYIATAIGSRETQDFTGVSWADQMADHSSTYAKALGSASDLNPSPWTAEQQMLKAFAPYSKDDPSYIRSWIDEISQLHLSVPARETARALLDPEYQPAGVVGDMRGLDAVNEWFSNGAGEKYLNDLRGAKLKWGSEVLNERSAADAYMASVRDRIMVKSGGDQTILDAIAHATPFEFDKSNMGITKSVDHGFRNYLGDHMDVGPEIVKGRVAGATLPKPRLLEAASQKILGALMDVPARVLTRSHAFKGFYAKEFDRLIHFMTPEAQAEAIGHASEAGVELSKPIATGALSLEEADTIAKARSIARMHDYLYYPGEKSTAEDILRNVMPFAAAWKSVIKRWSKLAVENPQIIRKTQMGVQSLQSGGFFHPDPALGSGDFFTMASPGIMRELTGAVGFPMEGSVAGLNIVGHGLPGVGPGVQMLAAAALPHSPITAGIQKFISPYGDPDLSGGLGETLFPGWVNKLRAGGYLGIGNFRWDPTARQQVTVQDLAKQAFSTAANSGKYDLTNLDTLQHLWGQSMAQAQRLYLWRGLAQFVTPTAPRFSPTTTLKNGAPIALFYMAQDYASMLKADKHDGQKATLDFVQKYGPNAIYAVEPDNLRTVYGAPTSTSGKLWKAAHSVFADKYSQVYGYFIPPDPARGPYQNYLDAIKNGDITPLTVKQWSLLAQQHLGNAIYSQVRSRLGPSPNKEQRAWLAQQKIGIQKQYPGFNLELGLPGTAKVQERINTLFGLPGQPGALEDPAVKDTPLAKTALTYLRLRDEALKAAGKNPVTGSLKGTKMARYRDWLFQNGTELAKLVPEFTPMWNNLLQSEVDPNG